MQIKSLCLLFFITGLIVSGCKLTDSSDSEDVATDSQSPTTSTNSRQTQAHSESARLNQFLNTVFERNLSRSPQLQTDLGFKTDYDKWDDISEQHQLKTLELAKKDLTQLVQFDRQALDPASQLNYDLFKLELERSINDYQWRHHRYPVNQMRGTHSMVAAFLINKHRINDISDAKAYIARLDGVPKLLAQLIESLKIKAKLGIIAPKFVFPLVIESSQNIIKGAPFEQDKATEIQSKPGSSVHDSTLIADFKKKLDAIALTEDERKTLIELANQSLIKSVLPAYQQLLSYLHQLEQQADDRDGAWKWPNGDEYYDYALKRTTTTDYSADQIHQIGLSEVKRIQQEMTQIKDKVGFKGDLKSFMAWMKSDPQFYLPPTQQGRDQYLQRATEVISDMKSRLDELFNVIPKAELEVKRVEAFREKAAGKAFYQSPAADGSRPGKYYANLFDMSAMPTYQLEALAYHEGIPGHHMQTAIAQELENVPEFRKYSSYTAYTEGWGLYSEYIPKEMGLYRDPYADFGRLAMELWRACRLVVDTGIHHMKWTRQQGIDYYVDNTPNATSDAIKMVNRHIVTPSQATAYKIGMLKILAIRAQAKKQLGDKFDIRQFHDLVLKGGAVPMSVLQTQVDQWVTMNLSETQLANKQLPVNKLQNDSSPTKTGNE